MKPEVDVLDSIGERIARDGLASLTDPERFYRAIWVLECEANNGSFHQFYSNDSGSLAHEALAGLRAVGAHKMAALFEASLALFPDSNIPDEREARNALLEAMSEPQLAAMDRLAWEFVDYPDDLAALLQTYVLAHDADFRGPRTLLDMWRSKRARGADTTPLYTREIDFAIEAEKDRHNSSRPCPVCDYPSPDYRATCKRCGFPLGTVK